MLTVYPCPSVDWSKLIRKARKEEMDDWTSPKAQ